MSHSDLPARRTALSVFVQGLAIDAHVGVYEHERGGAQPLILDVEIDLEAQHIGRLGDTINYERIAAHARRIAAAGHVDLVEQYAELLGQALLEDGRARRVRIRVRKPRAIDGAEAAGCEAVFGRE